jgi:hypothetical protein
MPLASWPILSRVGSVIAAVAAATKIFSRDTVQSIAKIDPGRLFKKVRPAKD